MGYTLTPTTNKPLQHRQTTIDPHNTRQARHLGRAIRQNPSIQTLYHNAILTASDKHTPTDTTQHTPTNIHILPITSTNNMENDKSPNLPHLQGANYAPWHLALRMYAFEIDATEHLSGIPQVTHNNGEIKQPETKQNRLFGAVLSSVSLNILGLILAPEQNPTAHELIS